LTHWIPTQSPKMDQNSIYYKEWCHSHYLHWLANHLQSLLQDSIPWLLNRVSWPLQQDRAYKANKMSWNIWDCFWLLQQSNHCTYEPIPHPAISISHRWINLFVVCLSPWTYRSEVKDLEFIPFFSHSRQSFLIDITNNDEHEAIWGNLSEARS
jgi:hypothetical protein